MNMTPQNTKIDHLRSNCTLVAAREVTGKSDEEIIAAFLARGYKWNKGTHASVYINAIRDLGFTVERTVVAKEGEKDRLKFTGRTNMWGNEVYRYERAALTVGAFAKKHKRGTFVVSDGGHAFVIRDGIVVDPNLERRGAMRRRKLVDAYKVVDAAPSRKLVETRLKRNADPYVKFAPVRGKLRPAEALARHFYLKKAFGDGAVREFGKPVIPVKVRLSEIVANTPYTRGDAAWDIRRGRLIVEAAQ